jgi:hypothetical protein
MDVTPIDTDENRTSAARQEAGGTGAHNPLSGLTRS